MFRMFVPWRVFDYSCVNLVSWTSMMQFSQFIADWKRLDKGFASNLTLRFHLLFLAKQQKQSFIKRGPHCTWRSDRVVEASHWRKALCAACKAGMAGDGESRQVRINKSTVCNLCNRPMKIYVSKVHWPPPQKQKQVTAHRALRLALQKILQHNWSFASRSHKWWEIREDASWDLWIFALLLWQRRSSVFHSIT